MDQSDKIGPVRACGPPPLYLLLIVHGGGAAATVSDLFTTASRGASRRPPMDARSTARFRLNRALSPDLFIFSIVFLGSLIKAARAALQKDSFQEAGGGLKMYSSAASVDNCHSQDMDSGIVS